MNMRQRFGLVLLIFWSMLPLKPSDLVGQIVWASIFLLSVCIFTFPSKDESK